MTQRLDLFPIAPYPATKPKKDGYYLIHTMSGWEIAEYKKHWINRSVGGFQGHYGGVDYFLAMRIMWDDRNSLIEE